MIKIPKSIIIKSNTSEIIEQLVNELSHYPNIRFLYKKINGENTLVIKCFNYYNRFTKENKKNFYGNYIYLYTCISLILSEIILTTQERLITKRLLFNNYFYFKKYDLQRIYNILCMILSSNSPIENSEELSLYRKQIILSSLLKNFRTANHLHIDNFVVFNMQDYVSFLDELIDTIIHLFLVNATSLESINFIIKSIFEDQ